MEFEKVTSEPKFARLAAEASRLGIKLLVPSRIEEMLTPRAFVANCPSCRVRSRMTSYHAGEDY